MHPSQTACCRRRCCLSHSPSRWPRLFRRQVPHRVGGHFRLVKADEHLRIEHTGEYRVIQPPELLVFTWRSEFTGMHDTLVTVRLIERRPHETEIEVTHELATDHEASSHAGGWSQLLGRLQAYVEDT